MITMMLSRVLGFVRDIAVTGSFSVGAQTDAYLAAFTIPDLIYFALVGGFQWLSGHEKRGGCLYCCQHHFKSGQHCGVGINRHWNLVYAAAGKNAGEIYR